MKQTGVLCFQEPAQSSGRFQNPEHQALPSALSLQGLRGWGRAGLRDCLSGWSLPRFWSALACHSREPRLAYLLMD